MSTTLVASGNTALSSADFALAANEEAHIFISDVDGGEVPRNAVAVIEVKNTTTSQYTTYFRLDRNNVGIVLRAVGTYRVRRLANDATFGVERG